MIQKLFNCGNGCWVRTDLISHFNLDVSDRNWNWRVMIFMQNSLAVEVGFEDKESAIELCNDLEIMINALEK